ncbi:MAG TPA: nucleotide sugar dehydrogenase [Bryobacteraceae bacterium]|nr:nucleotide sugar dehydrogenase [Bryobacteraceae bacterium]
MLESMEIGGHIAVLGLGYVGCVTAACFAELGYAVIGVDRDERKVCDVLAGRSPFYEPGLEPLVQRNIAAGRLSATSSLAEAIQDAAIAFLCVGTPSAKNGDLGLEQLQRVVAEIAATLPARTKPLIVVVRSTVFPGTCEEVVIPALDRGNASVVSNPEFLREGVAVRDFMEPSLVVVGGSDEQAVERVAQLYAPLGKSVCLVSLRTAEMIKYACNAFHAVKIAFANEIGTLSRRLNIDPSEVMSTLCDDVKLNVSSAYLKPGFAFGGSCLPKDLRALVYRAGRLDVKLPLIQATLPSNNEHLERAISDVLEIPSERVAIIGLAFKEQTDDLRESPVVALLERLIGKGRQVRVFDPHIQLDSIHGANRSFILQTIPHIGRLLDSTLDETLAWAEHLVLTQVPDAETSQRIRDSGLPVTDLAGKTLQGPMGFPNA